MRKTAIILTVFVALSATAQATPRPGVKGAGFTRAADRTKTMLSITAFDQGLTGDFGQAQLVRHKPGSKATPVHISLDCVAVADSTAFASGTGSDGNGYLIVIRDNGEGQEDPDELGITGILGTPVSCMTAGLSGEGAMGTIDGGNFQVFSN
jgi:hypothetical protein